MSEETTTIGTLPSFFCSFIFGLSEAFPEHLARESNDMDAIVDSQHEDQSKDLNLLVTAWVLCSLVIVFSSLRGFARVRIIRSVGWDDYLLLLAAGLAIATSSLTPAIVKNGLHPYQTSSISESLVVFELLTIACLAFSRVSICIFMLNILQGSAATKRRRFLYFNMVLLLLTSMLTIGLTLGQCQPFVKIWDFTIPGTCKYRETLQQEAYFNGAVSAWTDFSLAAFPITFIKKLQMDARRKISLLCLTSVGVFAGAAAVARTIFLSDVSKKLDTVSVEESVIWAIDLRVEMDLCIMAACAPALRPLYIVTAERIGSWKRAYSRLYLSRDYQHQNNDSPSSVKLERSDIELVLTRPHHIT